MVVVSGFPLRILGIVWGLDEDLVLPPVAPMAEGWPKRRTISLSGVRERFGPVANAAWMKVKFL